jgi:hypothetical protein
VYSLNHLYVTTRQDEMRKAAANERLARTPQSSQRTFSLGSVLKSVRSFLSGPAERPSALPNLTNYPYRG